MLDGFLEACSDTERPGSQADGSDWLSKAGRPAYRDRSAE